MNDTKEEEEEEEDPMNNRIHARGAIPAEM
jgi:hypothetical protein